jgi:tetratricopeptide (TPR) repeat protein
MKSNWIFLWILAFLSGNPELAGQGIVPDFIDSLQTFNSEGRIMALSRFQEEVSSRNLTPQKIELLFKELYTITDSFNDAEFRRFVEFYERMSPGFFLPQRTKHQMLIPVYEKAIPYYLSRGDYRFAGITCLHRGFDEFMLRRYDKAIECALQGDDLLKKAGYERVPHIGKYLHDMALIFYYFGEYRRVVELMEESVKHRPVDVNRDIQRYNSLGLASLNLKHYNKAEKAFRETIACARRHKTDIWIAIGSNNLARLYLATDRYEEALKLALTTLHHIDIELYPREYAEQLLSIASAYLALKQNDKAGVYLQKLNQIPQKSKRLFFSFGEKQQNEKFKQNYFNVQMRYHAGVKDFMAAYAYSDSLKAANKALDSIYNSLQVHIAAQTLKIRENQSEIEREKVEKHRVSLRSWVIAVSITFLAIGFAILYYTSLSKMGKEKALFSKREKLLEKEKQKIKDELVGLNNEIQDYLAEITDRNRQIEKLSAGLQKLKKENALGNKEAIRTAEEGLRGLKIITKEQWVSFLADFEKIHPSFTRKVKKDHLYSEAELRLLMLSKLQFSSKDIGNILGISDNAVRVTWYRIRKKLGISPETSPEEILKKYS